MCHSDTRDMTENFNWIPLVLLDTIPSKQTDGVQYPCKSLTWGVRLLLTLSWGALQGNNRVKCWYRWIHMSIFWHNEIQKTPKKQDQSNQVSKWSQNVALILYALQVNALHRNASKRSFQQPTCVVAGARWGWKSGQKIHHTLCKCKACCHCGFSCVVGVLSCQRKPCHSLRTHTVSHLCAAWRESII